MPSVSLDNTIKEDVLLLKVGVGSVQRCGKSVEVVGSVTKVAGCGGVFPYECID